VYVTCLLADSCVFCRYAKIGAWHALATSMGLVDVISIAIRVFPALAAGNYKTAAVSAAILACGEAAIGAVSPDDVAETLTPVLDAIAEVMS